VISQKKKKQKKNKTKQKEERVQLKKVLWRYVMRFTQKKKTNGLRLKNKKTKKGKKK
jgi:hypothetical protein